MGSIELKLNISRVDLIIACSVVVIATILIIGFIIWLVKSSRQNKALKSIDNRLAVNEMDLTKSKESNLKIIETDIAEKNAAKDVIRDINININEGIVRDSQKAYHEKCVDDKSIEAGDKKENIDNQYSESKSLDDMKAKQQSYIDEKLKNDDGEDVEVDVMAEIHKMLKETESQGYEKPGFLRYNTGKSGKTYTEEDLRNVIRD